MAFLFETSKYDKSLPCTGKVDGSKTLSRELQTLFFLGKKHFIFNEISTYRWLK